MRKITLLLTVMAVVSVNVFAGIDPTTAWLNGQSFETYTAGTDQKSTFGFSTISGYSVFAQSVTTTSASATGIVLGLTKATASAFAESAGGSTYTKTFATPYNGGYFYIKTAFYSCTGGTKYIFNNSSGNRVFEFGGTNPGSSTAASVYIYADANYTTGLGKRGTWTDIEAIIDLSNNSLVSCKVDNSAQTLKTYSISSAKTLPYGGTIGSLLVTSTSYSVGGLDNTTIGKLMADNIKTLTGASPVQSLSSGTVTSDYTVTSFTTAMSQDFTIDKTDLNIVWDISNYGVLTGNDLNLVTLTKKVSDSRIATLSVGAISQDANITLRAVLGGTTLTKIVTVKAPSTDGAKALLLTEIGTANGLMTAISDSNPYINGAKSTLTDVVTTSTTMYNNASATLSDINTALSNLQAAETTFNTAKAPFNTFVTYFGTVSSSNNAETRTGASAIKDALTSATQTATAARSTVSSTDDIATAQSNLQTAYNQFTSDMAVFNTAYTNLQTQITTVSSKITSVNTRKGDTRFLMFPTATVNTLSTAKTTADGVLASGTVTDLNSALTTLSNALTAFNAAPRVSSGTSYYRMYTYGINNGDGDTNKKILYSDGTNLKYALQPNSAVSINNSAWKISEPSTGNFTFQNIGSGNYLNGTTFSSTQSQFVLLEGFSSNNSIVGSGDTYFIYYFTNATKSLQITSWDAASGTGGFTFGTGTPANRYRYCFQYEPIATWTGSANWSSTSNWSAGILPASGLDIIIASGESTMDQNATVGNTLIANGAKLTIGSGKTLTASSVIVSSNASSGGLGTISGATTINGTLEGSLNFGSTLTLSSTAITNLTITDFTGTNDVLTVTGAVTNGGTLNITLPASAPAVGTSIKLINAGSYSGTFATKTLPSGYRFDDASGTLYYDGTSISSNTTLTTIPDNGVVTVNGGELTINQNVALSSLTVAPSAKVTLNSGKTLTATTVTLQSDPSGTATFVDADATGSTITATVQQYLPTGRNWYVGVPFIDASATSASALTAAGAASVSYWDETAGAWVNSYSGALSRGRGYISVSASGSSTNNISFTGTLNTGSIPVTVTRTVGATKEGFNLIANPYPSYLNAMTAINASVKMEPTIWYRTKGTSYEFETVNTASGVGTNVSLTGQVTGYVPPMQAFWVRVLPNANPLLGNSETLTFTNAMRYHANPTVGQTTIPTTVMKAPSATKSLSSVLRLQVSNGTNSDEAIIYTNANAANGYDAYDSEKMTNGNVAIPEIYSVVGNENLVINGLNSIQPNMEIPLGFTTKQTNTFTIKASEISNFDGGTSIMLYDNKLNKQQELTTTNAYSFSSDSVVTTSRFSIVFKTNSVATGLNTAGNNQAVEVYKNANNQIVINSSRADVGVVTVSVFNAIGQKLESKTITGTTTVVTNSYAAGVYVISVLTNGKTTTQKVVLN